MRKEREPRTVPEDGATFLTLSALAEPNRLRIVELLRRGPLPVGEIAQQLGLRQPQTSKHLRVLAEAGILEVTAKANRRIYGLKSDPFHALGAWLETFQRAMASRFDILDRYLQGLQRHPSDGSR